MLYVITSIINKYSSILLYVNNEYINMYKYLDSGTSLREGLYTKDYHLAYNWRCPNAPYAYNAIYRQTYYGMFITTSHEIPKRMKNDFKL